MPKIQSVEMIYFCDS